MALLAKLTEKLGSAKQEWVNKKDFKQKLIEVCQDGKLSELELQQINDLATEYGIEEEDFKKVNVPAYQAAFKAIISDGIITEQEERDIFEIQQTLLVENQQIPKQVEVINYHRQLRNIQNGILPIVSNSGLILTDNEQVHFLARTSLLEERVVKRGYQGGSTGMNIRIAKGVSFKVGAHKGRLTSETDIIPIDDGMFYVTNKRLVYKGGKKSFSYTFAQLVGYEVFKNGIDVQPIKGDTRKLKFTQQIDSDVLDLIINVALSN